MLLRCIVFITLVLISLVLIKYYSSKVQEKNDDFDDFENRILQFENKMFRRQLVDDHEISLIPIKSRLAVVK